MTKHRPTETGDDHHHDYVPAAGRDALLPFYDLFTAALGVSTVHRALIGQAELTDGQRVLEIGCGTGNLSIRAKRAHPGVELIGSDPDPRALARAQRKAGDLKGISFERGYGQRLPFPDAAFDRVLSALMLHHLDDHTRAATAAEVRRVLRPGGRLHLVDFAGQAHGAHGFLARRVLKSGHVADNSGDNIPRLFTTAGLDCAQLASHRLSVMGRIAYFRATRPQ